MTGAVTTWIERLVKNADAAADIFSSVKSFSPREEKSLRDRLVMSPQERTAERTPGTADTDGQAAILPPEYTLPSEDRMSALRPPRERRALPLTPPGHRRAAAHHHAVGAEKSPCEDPGDPEPRPAFPENLPDSQSHNGDMKPADGKEVGYPILPVKFINFTVQIILLPKENRDRIPASSGRAIAFNRSEKHLRIRYRLSENTCTFPPVTVYPSA